MDTDHIPPHRPLNIAYLTSGRELGLDEQVGRHVVDPENGREYGYRMGNLEHLARLLQTNHNPVAQQFNLTAIIIDDDDDQHEQAWEQEIWPRDLSVPMRDGHGQVVAERKLHELTARIPSHPWRSIRTKVDGIADPVLVEQKAAAKAHYEQRILDIFHQRQIDLAISDSYVCIIGPTLLGAYKGRMLNVHPAIAQVGHPARLPGVTPTRDAYTRAKHGYIIIDDKHAVDVPEGSRIQVNYGGRTRIAVQVPRLNTTGVTVHVVSPRVDNGPVVLHREYQFDPDTITYEAIRDNNYRHKRELLPTALLEYAARPDVMALIATARSERAGQTPG